MPDHKVHRGIDLLILGKSHDEVHKAMDFPVKLLGKRHRILFHDYPSILLMFWSDPEALKAACLHKVIDDLCSANPTLKALLSMKK